MKKDENSSNKNLRVGLYDPYLDIVGGGEKHILSILKVLDEKGYEIVIFFDQDLTAEFDKKLNLRFDNLHFAPNVFHKSFLTKNSILKDFDLFFYVTDGSYFFSKAKKNFVFAMVPNRELYKLTLLNKLKLRNFKFITNSLFTKSHLKKWGVKSDIIYPSIDEAGEQITSFSKKKIILSVGRFFGQLHNKKHAEVIRAFNLLQKTKEFADFKLVLVGGVKEEDRDYFKSIEELAKKNGAITLEANISFDKLKRYYKEALFFWHFTGFGIDENQEPMKAEHLGITPLEAMATGSIVFCYNAGGPKEFIEDSKNGFLFSSVDELIDKMKKNSSNTKQLTNMRDAGRKYVKENFSYSMR